MVLFKDAVKMGDIFIPDRIGNISDLAVGLFQKSFGLRDPDSVEVLLEGAFKFLLEDTRYAGRQHTGLLPYFGN